MYLKWRNSPHDSKFRFNLLFPGLIQLRLIKWRCFREIILKGQIWWKSRNSPHGGKARLNLLYNLKMKSNMIEMKKKSSWW